MESINQSRSAMFLGGLGQCIYAGVDGEHRSAVMGKCEEANEGKEVGAVPLGGEHCGKVLPVPSVCCQSHRY